MAFDPCSGKLEPLDQAKHALSGSCQEIMHSTRAVPFYYISLSVYRTASEAIKVYM